MAIGIGVFTNISRSTTIKFAGVSSLEGAFTTTGNETFGLLTLTPPPSIRAARSSLFTCSCPSAPTSTG